jgi:hypothetical protein
MSARDRAIRLRTENPEKYREQSKKSKIRLKKWRADNPEKYREQAAKYRQKNRERLRAQKRRWEFLNPDKGATASRYRHEFGFTLDDWNQEWERQGKRCAICKRTQHTKKRFHLDHCHKTNAIRGILCPRCNRVLGLCKDDPDLLLEAAKYLKRGALLLTIPAAQSGG